MSISTSAVADALDGLRPFEGADPCALTPAQLLAAQDAAARLRRAAEAVLAGLAFEVGRRSTADAGAGGLARSQGFASPGQLIASAAGGSVGDAMRLMDAGAAMVGGASRSPDSPAPPSPLASAIAAGDIGAEKAALLHTTLMALGERAPEFEDRLLAKAKVLSLKDLKRACEFTRASADTRAWAEREARQLEARCVTVTEDSDGMVVINARLDPPSAAPVIAWLDAQVKDAFRRRRDGDPLASDQRTVGQIRADALVGLARHGLSCDEPTSGVSTTVVVRMTLEQLRAGLDATGLGTCGDIKAPLTAGAIRRMAVDAEVIPVVLGADSEVLDFGRNKRLFSRAQRLALVERDGGCAMCHAPPSYTEVHHIRWWDRDVGRTDLANGVLLCTGRHHRVHRDGWEIEATAHEVWITPPASVDPTRTPRLGGLGRLHVAA